MSLNGLVELPKVLLTQVEQILGQIKFDNSDLDNVIEGIINYYENIIGCMPGNVYWLDKQGIAVGCNQNVLKMFGLNSLAEFRGLSFEDMGRVGNWTPLAIQKFKRDTLEVIHTGKPRLNIEEPPIPHQDGRTLYFLTHRVPLFDNQKNVIGVVGISIDITERKNMEASLLKAKDAAEAADKAKTEFLMNMRHDIRTPLSGIIGFAGLIKDETRDSNIAEYADNMLASSQALLDFLNEILETIKITSGEIPVLKKKFDLKEKLLSVITLNQTKAKQKNLLLDFEYDERLPRYLLGDSKRLQRIVLELVSNALNFTHQGEINIKTIFANENHKEVTFKLIISDTGIGIPKNKLEEVFVRFTRLNPAYEGIYRGVGVGLTIIKQFIDDLEGEIYVDSEVNKGSTFTCVFRFKKALLEDEQGVDHSLEITSSKNSAIHIHSLNVAQVEQQPTQSNIRILVVEDSRIAALVTEKLLTRLGCQVDVAADGQLGLMKAKLNTYDGIFMDVGLPDMSGNEVTQAFRAWETNLTEDRRTPIIALTAHVETEEKQNCIESGMDAVLSKPLTQEKAIDILAAFIPKYADKLLPPKISTPCSEEIEEKLPVIDGATVDLELANEVAGDPEFAREMLQLLVSAIPEEREHLSKAYSNNNWKEIQAISHKLKGSAAYCGAVRLSLASNNLQNYIKSEKTKLRELLYQQLLDEMNLIYTHLEHKNKITD